MSDVPRKWVTSHMNESCHIWMSPVTYKWVMSQPQPYSKLECHATYIWAMSHEWVMPRMNESCHTWTRRVTYKRIMLHVHKLHLLYLQNHKVFRPAPKPCAPNPIPFPWPKPINKQVFRPAPKAGWPNWCFMLQHQGPLLQHQSPMWQHHVAASRYAKGRCMQKNGRPKWRTRGIEWERKRDQSKKRVCSVFLGLCFRFNLRGT